jgi:PAS domain S-box-containing protein
LTYNKEEVREKYKDLFESPFLLVYVRDLKGNFLDANDSTLKALGYTKNDFEKITFKDLIDEFQFKKAIGTAKEIFQMGKQTSRVDYKLKKKDGTFLYVETIGFPLKKGDEIYSVFGIAQVISERKIFEEKLKVSEEKYRLITENISDLIAVLNNKFELEFVNKLATQKHLGYRGDEFLGRSLVTLIHPDDLRVAVDAVQNPAISEIREVRIRFKHKDGHWVWLECMGRTFTDWEGEEKGLVIARDITERKKADEVIRESEERYRTLFEGSTDGIAISSLDGKILNANQAYQDMLGYTLEELRNLSIQEITPKKWYEPEAIAMKEFMKVGHGLFEKEYIRKDGTIFPVQLTGWLIKDKQGNPIKIGGFFKDISERKKAEEALLKSEEKYRSAYERENFYKDLFAHDMNNILQAITTALDICDIKMKNDANLEDMNEMKSIIRDQVDRGANLVRNVKRFSEIEESAIILEKTNVNKFVENAIKIIGEETKERKINIRFEPSEDENYVQANEFLLDVFENILINAVRHNDNPEVEILVKTSKVQEKNKDFIKIQFIDNGKGIPDSRKQMIFTRGFKEEKSISGLGLGLSLVKKILDLYNAKIWVENKVPEDFSKGSNFIVLFPEVE